MAGIITLESPLAIHNPYLTLAGQTAPGDGVCIRGQTVEINTHDVVIRYLRFRRGNLKVRDDALGGYPIGNVIIDHVSASWGLDENLSMYRYMQPLPDGRQEKLAVENLTIQWCISSEALDLNNHAFGGTWGGKQCSFHHNLFACNTGRNPSIGMGGGFDYRNNVIFNWRHRTMDGGDGSSRVNVVANYYKPGPATTDAALRYRICKAEARNARDRFPGFGKWYVADNFVDGNPAVTRDNWAGGVQYSPPQRDKDEVVPMGTERDVRSLEPFASPSDPTFGGGSLRIGSLTCRRELAAPRCGRRSRHRIGPNGQADLQGRHHRNAGRRRRLARVQSGHAAGRRRSRRSARRLGAAARSEPQRRPRCERDNDGDGYTNIEEYLNGTDPSVSIDYTRPENNRSALPRRG